jgi:hypothetical protein
VAKATAALMRDLPGPRWLRGQMKADKGFEVISVKDGLAYLVDIQSGMHRFCAPALANSACR